MEGVAILGHALIIQTLDHAGRLGIGLLCALDLAAISSDENRSVACRSARHLRGGSREELSTPPAAASPLNDQAGNQPPRIAESQLARERMLGRRSLRWPRIVGTLRTARLPKRVMPRIRNAAQNKKEVREAVEIPQHLRVGVLYTKSTPLRATADSSAKMEFSGNPRAPGEDKGAKRLECRVRLVAGLFESVNVGSMNP